jgi:RNA polymerase sigma factor (sigma-70 family)
MNPEGESLKPSLAEGAFTHYGAELHRFLIRRLRRAEDAEDLAQEVFMRLARMENSDFVKNPRAYLFGIAGHVVSEYRIRDQHLESWLVFDEEIATREAERPAAVHLDQLSEELDIKRQLRRALERLPAVHRAVFVLHKRDGYSYEEIAARLQISVRKIETYLADAKAQLRKMKWDR